MIFPSELIVGNTKNWFLYNFFKSVQNQKIGYAVVAFDIYIEGANEDIILANI